MDKKKIAALAPLAIVIPYMIYVMQDRFSADERRRDEIIAEKQKKEKLREQQQ